MRTYVGTNDEARVGDRARGSESGAMATCVEKNGELWFEYDDAKRFRSLHAGIATMYLVSRATPVAEERKPQVGDVVVADGKVWTVRRQVESAFGLEPLGGGTQQFWGLPAIELLPLTDPRHPEHVAAAERVPVAKDADGADVFDGDELEFCGPDPDRRGKGLRIRANPGGVGVVTSPCGWYELGKRINPAWSVYRLVRPSGVPDTHEPVVVPPHRITYDSAAFRLALLPHVPKGVELVVDTVLERAEAGAGFLVVLRVGALTKDCGVFPHGMRNQITSAAAMVQHEGRLLLGTSQPSRYTLPGMPVRIRTVGTR